MKMKTIIKSKFTGRFLVVNNKQFVWLEASATEWESTAEARQVVKDYGFAPEQVDLIKLYKPSER